MCDPTKAENVAPLNALQSSLCEIISAQSALHMPPEPQPTSNPAALEFRPAFLSETDVMVAHSIEHMRAAFALVNKAHQAQESLKTQVFRLVVQLRELGAEPRVKTWLDEIEPIPGMKG